MRDRRRSEHERARPVLTTKVSFAEHCRDDRGERSPVLTITTPTPMLPCVGNYSPLGYARRLLRSAGRRSSAASRCDWPGSA